MKERITQIIQKEEMTAAQFAEKIGISPSSLSVAFNLVNTQLYLYSYKCIIYN